MSCVPYKAEVGMVISNWKSLVSLSDTKVATLLLVNSDAVMQYYLWLELGLGDKILRS